MRVLRLQEEGMRYVQVCAFELLCFLNHDDLNFPFTAVKLTQIYSMESCSVLRRH